MQVRAVPVLMISTIAHGALIAYVAHRAYDHEPHPHLTAFAVPQLPPPPAPSQIEVAFLVEEPTVKAPQTPSTATPGPRAVRAATASITTSTTPGTATVPGTETK